MAGLRYVITVTLRGAGAGSSACVGGICIILIRFTFSFLSLLTPGASWRDAPGTLPTGLKGQMQDLQNNIDDLNANEWNDDSTQTVDQQVIAQQLTSTNRTILDTAQR